MDEKILIQLDRVTYKYRTQIALKTCSLGFEKGKIYGLIGPNGAGKTTMFRVISGLLKPTSGKLYLFGNEKINYNRKRMGFLIENPYLDLEMTAYQNMKYMALLNAFKDDKRIELLLHQVGLANVVNKRVKTFSLGMKQRLGIAMALLNEPEVLVLDEPMNGLDPKGIVDMRKLLRMLCDKNGTTIIISSHILLELERLADKFIMIKHGTIVAQVDKNELTSDNALEELYLEKMGE